MLAVLMVIFVVTAYAGPHGHHGSTTTNAYDTTTTLVTPSGGQSGPVPAPIGDCLLRQPGFDAMVPCNQPNNGLVVAMAASSDQCPPQSTSYELAGRHQIVCLIPTGPSSHSPP
jgi:hypothetical protein